MFFGWITVAAFANLESYVVYTGNTGSILVAPAGAVLLMILATVVSVLVAFALRDASFPAVVAWAMFGIAVASRGVDRVSTFATFCAVTCLVLSSYSLYAQRKHPRFKPPKHGPLPVAKAHRAELETYS